MMMKRMCVVATMLAVGCYSGVEDELGDSELKLAEHEVIVENLLEAGFPEDDIMVLDDGRVVVGRDAVVTLQASRELAGIVTDGEEGDDQFRQYRTTATVNTAAVQTICVNPSAAWEANALMLQALDVAIQHYNEQNLQFTMARDGAGCTAGNNGTLNAATKTWTLAGNLDNSGGGVAGFPAGGMPYTTINVDQGLAADYGVPVATHVIQHELGHCIGFRHTDYYDRSISCGGFAQNEGDGGVGAIHIAGTPTTAVINGSVMNSCYSVSSNGLWTASDVTALDCLYDSGACAPAPPPTYSVIDTQANLSASAGQVVTLTPSQYNASGLDAIRFSISGGTGDADLYVRFDDAPTTTNYDCRPYLNGNNESCEFNPPQSGNYHVMIRAYSAFSGVTLTVEGAGGAPVPDEVCDNGADDDGDGAADCDDTDCAGEPVCAPPPPPPGGWDVLSSTNFDSGWGIYNDGGSDCQRLNNSTYATSGSYSAEIRDNSGVASSFYSDPFSLSGYSQLQIEFSFIARSMENGEDFFVELWNGSSWVVIANWARGADFNNNTFYDATISLDSTQVAFSNNAQLRFRADASANNDLINIDDIVVSAQ
ncbi:M57 family metalloprotease [Paraliomyxa miuraensis]|uniref:M57 family metalloprotease n=1 Tax=Paraliomyxa miuraensis TaxID=376150 RepID=UPI002257BB3C|nr:M57 family metalloprotease [Paraliomyxa miuraensis]MCX4243467.1 M57 family metalloprotease [Paraliomyxa miuraensis]